MERISKRHRLKKRELIRDIFFIFSEEYEKSDANSIWEIKLPMETLLNFLKDRYKANYTSSSWVKLQIRRYEKEIRDKLFNITKGNGSDDHIYISINKNMHNFFQHHHLYISHKIKIANGIYGIIQDFIKTNKIERPLNILLGSGTNPYFVANILAQKSWSRKEEYNIYTHNMEIIKKLTSTRTNPNKIKVYVPPGRIDPAKNTIMGKDNTLYESIQFDFIIQSTRFLYNGKLYVEKEEEAIRKRAILNNCSGVKILALIKDEITANIDNSMACYGDLVKYDYIVTPRTRSNKQRLYDTLFQQYTDILREEIINWNYCIFSVKK